LDLDFADDEVVLLLLEEAMSSAAGAETVGGVIRAFLFRLGLNEYNSLFSLLILLQIFHDSQKIYKLSFEAIQFNCNQIKQGGSKVNRS
jgi:hypothetical protein